MGSIGLMAAAFGVVSGVALSFVALRILRSELYGVRVYDLLTLTVVPSSSPSSRQWRVSCLRGESLGSTPHRLFVWNRASLCVPADHVDSEFHLMGTRAETLLSYRFGLN